MTTVPTLFDREVAAHCFWYPRCPEIIRDFDPVSAHDRMEAHYTEAHGRDIELVVGHYGEAVKAR